MAASSAPTLTDGSVTLRAHRPDDAQGSLRAVPGPASQRWTTVPVPYSMEDARDFVEEVCPGGWADDSEWAFAIEHEGRYAGTISLRHGGRRAVPRSPTARTRRSAAPASVERALRLLLEWGFDGAATSRR